MKKLYICILVGLFSVSFVKAETEVKVKKIEVSISSEDLEQCSTAAIASKKGLRTYTCKLNDKSDYIILGSDQDQELSFKYEFFTEGGRAKLLSEKWVDAKVVINQGKMTITIASNGAQLGGGTYLQNRSIENAFDKLIEELEDFSYTLVVVNK